MLSTVLVSLNFFVFVVAASMMMIIFISRRNRSTPWLALLFLSFCEISFFVLNVYAQNDFATKILFSRLRFIGFALLTPAWLLFLSANYQRWTWLQGRLIKALLFFPGLITIALTLNPAWQDYVIKDFTPFMIEGLSVLKFSGGPWFQFHFLWSLLLTLASILLAAYIFVKESPVRRRQIFFLMSGTILAVFVDVYCVVTDSPWRWAMLSSATYLFTGISIAYSSYRHHLLDITPLATEKIYLDLPDPVLVGDHRGRLRSFNASAKKIFDLTEASLALPINEVLPQLEGGSSEIEVQDGHDRVRYFDLSIENLGDDHGRQGKLFYLREATLRKETEIRLGRDIEFRARLMALISHDLSGHMQNQARLSQTLHQSVSAEMQPLAQMIAGSIASSDDLMRNIISWAKTQEEGFKPSLRPFEVRILIEDVIAEIESIAQAYKVKVDLAASDSPLIAKGDSEMIASIVRNFLTNALKASVNGGSVEVLINKRGDKIFIEVVDHGIGMSRERIEEVLAGTATHSAQSKYARGYGIGFHLAKRFVELHGGTVAITSELNLGTRVAFTLPL